MKTTSRAAIFAYRTILNFMEDVSTLTSSIISFHNTHEHACMHACLIVIQKLK